MSSEPKKLDVVDKWRARVLFGNTLPVTDSWPKRMERQMAVLRVFFPFLTEKQLRGKAWTACGLRSLMGELPRSGLSLEVKRSFMKKGKNSKFTMSPKPKIKKEPATHEKNKLELSTYSCLSGQSNAELLLPQGNIVIDALPQTPVNYLNSQNLLSTNEIIVSSINNDESTKKRAVKRKLKPIKFDFNIQENAPLTNIIIPETSEISWEESNDAVKYKDLYCTQISKKKPTIIMSIDTYTPATISHFSTATQLEKKNCSDLNNVKTSKMNLISDHQNHSEPAEQSDSTHQSHYFVHCENQLQNIQRPLESLNRDSSSIFFKSNSLLTSPANCWSNPIPNKEKLALYESTPFKQAIIENTNTSTNSEFSNTGYQNVNDNASQNGNSTPFIFSQTLSLPSTPLEPFENQPLLSNLCCEYEKAYDKEEYKPVPYISSIYIVKKLKEGFDEIIPPQVSLIKYFEGEEKSFKRIKSEVFKKVNDIILALEEDETRKIIK